MSKSGVSWGVHVILRNYSTTPLAEVKPQIWSFTCSHTHIKTFDLPTHRDTVTPSREQRVIIFVFQADCLLHTSLMTVLFSLGKTVITVQPQKEGAQCGASKVAANLYNMSSLTIIIITVWEPWVCEYCALDCTVSGSCGFTQNLYLVCHLVHSLLCHAVLILFSHSHSAFFLRLRLCCTPAALTHCYACSLTLSLSYKSYLTGMHRSSPTLPPGNYPVSDLSAHIPCCLVHARLFLVRKLRGCVCGALNGIWTQAGCSTSVTTSSFTYSQCKYSVFILEVYHNCV